MNTRDRFEEIFLLYLIKSKTLLIAKKQIILQQIRNALLLEIEKRNWEIDDMKRHIYHEITVSFYEESLWDIDFLIKRKKRCGSFGITQEHLESLYRFEKHQLGYSFEEESINVGRDINRFIDKGIPPDTAADLLLKKYAMITTSTLLALEGNLTPNFLPDFVLAKIKRSIVDDYFDSRKSNAGQDTIDRQTH